MEEKKISASNIKSFFSRDNLPMLCLIGLVIVAVAFIVISIMALSINPIVACLMVILEAGLAACLNKIQLWIHGLVFIGQIICGVIASQVVFMVLMALIYVLAIAFLFIWANK